MIWFWLFVTGTTVALGVVAQRLAPTFGYQRGPYSRYESYGYSISRTEFVLCLLVIGIVVAPLTSYIGDKMSIAQQIEGFHEFWNGSVTDAGVSVTQCTEDGPCAHEFDCHPYEDGYYETYTDANGDTQSRYVSRTSYRDCPYVTVEYTYWITTNIHDEPLIVDGSVLDVNPVVWDPSEGRGIPGVQRGPSEEWSRTRAALDAGNAPPVTKTNDYSNFVIASQDDTFKEFSTSIDRYRKAKILPSHTVGVPENDDPTFGGLKATKFQFVGLPVQPGWNDALSDLNARLGPVMQGDMHVVAAKASLVDNADEYTSALVAYWQSLGKWGIAKNSINLVLGVSDDGNEIKWARAETGMPLGNEEMETSLKLRLDGTPFTVENVFGDTIATPAANGKLKYTWSENAIVPKTIFKDFPFKRACMQTCDGDGDGDGFVYLGDQVESNLSFPAYLLMWFICTLIAAGLWAVCATVLRIRESNQ